MVPLFDLKIQYQSLREEIRAAIDEVLDNAHYTLGPAVSAFEQDFAGYCAVKHAIGVNNGTNAIQLALLAAGVGRGDEVITVPHTFIATVAAIRYTGATPVLVDIDAKTFTMDVSQIVGKITPRTKAILPVHLYGQPAEMDTILEIARTHNLKVIEDCAQAHGATYRGRRVGSFGDYGCFSFYPSKNLGACGEGGMVITNVDTGAQTLRMLRDWGAQVRNKHEIPGFNMRMEGVQGAVLGVKLRYLEQWVDQRRACAAYYQDQLAEVDCLLPGELEHTRHAYHLYVIQSVNRNELHAHLNSLGVNTGVHYPTPIHLQQAHSDLGYKKGDFPVCEHAARTVLSLPMFPELTREQQNEVVSAIGTFAQMELAR
jgi:dTDP-4-amino-4,6-dideoxygalactose transaminase